LLNLVDKKRLPFTVAVEISYIDPEVQGWLYEYIRENGQVKLNQISVLRDQMKTGVISQSKMIEILHNSQPGRLPSLKLTFTENNLREFFPEWYSVSQMRSVIEDLLSEWKMNREEGGLFAFVVLWMKMIANVQS
jgi:ParB family chromosome partitioning protein